jgi:hypothetical protein
VAAGKSILGIERFKSTIKEARDLVLRSTKASARMATPEEQAKRLPPDTPFLLPNGRLATRSAEGDYTFLDGGPD